MYGQRSLLQWGPDGSRAGLAFRLNPKAAASYLFPALVSTFTILPQHPHTGHG